MEDFLQAFKRTGVKSDGIAFTFFGREYTVINILRTVICVCGYIILRRAWLMHARKQHMARLQAMEEENEKEGKQGLEEEVIIDQNKKIPLDYESDGEGWGSKAKKRQREARRRAEEEAERRNLEEENGGIDRYLD